MNHQKEHANTNVGVNYNNEPQVHWMLGNGTYLNILEDMKNPWKSALEWTPHSCKVSTLRTHIHSSAGYRAGHIPSHVPFVYKH